MPWAFPATQPNLPIIGSPNSIRGILDGFLSLNFNYLPCLYSPLSHILSILTSASVAECLWVPMGASMGHGIDMGKSVSLGHNTTIGLIFGALDFVFFFLGFLFHLVFETESCIV